MCARAAREVSLNASACLREGAAWVSAAVARGDAPSSVLAVVDDALSVLELLLSAALEEVSTGMWLLR
jgi:hypothetical protein